MVKCGVMVMVMYGEMWCYSDGESKGGSDGHGQDYGLVVMVMMVTL